jgi:hypothetical protein
MCLRLDYRIAIMARLFLLGWVAGTAGAQDYPIFKWNPQRADWDLDATGGRASRIAVAPDGSPWVVNSIGQIFHLAADSWKLVPGLARDIAIGSDGGVYVIGGDPRLLQDGPIYYLERDGNWTSLGGAALNISVGGGQPFVVNTAGRIFTWLNSSWMEIAGRLATDIAIGSRGTPWITGTNGEISFLGRANTWTQIPGQGFRIAAGPDGALWAITLERAIYRLAARVAQSAADGKRQAASPFELVPGRANDIGIGADGSVWVIGYSPAPEVTALPASVYTKAPGIPPIPQLPPQEITDIKATPDLHKVLISFHTTQSASPRVEICRRRPEPDLTFNSTEILVIDAPIVHRAVQQGTVHTRGIDGLTAGTHYYFVITVWDRKGKALKVPGEFTTSSLL